MAWFRRNKDNFSPDSLKSELPDGQWEKCPECGEIIHKKQLETDFWTCRKCNYHFKISSKDYINILLDKGSFKEINKGLKSGDPLNFTDSKPYPQKILEATKKTGLNDAILTGTGKLNSLNVALGCMDFSFIGGSMGSVVGEKISRLIDKAYNNNLPLIIVSASGGARMMEGAYSLMQMVKTSSKLAKYSGKGLPYISVLTNPTTGGTTASFAMLGDFNIAEPKALIGFAGPRVIKQTIGKELPEGFQTSEFLLEHGFLDKVVHRKELKNVIYNLINLVI